MTALAHISDLHFGREDPAIAEALLADLAALGPSLVAVSGDLTQRALRREFEAARAYLQRLPAPVVAVPGNHDVPLYNLAARLLSPYAAYRRHLSAETDPFLYREEVAVLGLNTARGRTWKSGSVAAAQVESIRECFAPLPPRVFKVLVTHHPFLPAPGDPAPARVGGGLQALLAAEASGVDLLLAGHLHLGYSGDLRPHYLSLRRSMLVAQAGTAISRRTRLEPNTYNWILIDPPHLEVMVRGWAGGRFEAVASTRFVKHDGEWRRD